MKCKDELHYIKLNSIGDNRSMQWGYGIVKVIERFKSLALVSEVGH